MEVAVYNKSGENTGRKVELKDSIFAPRLQAVHGKQSSGYPLVVAQGYCFR